MPRVYVNSADNFCYICGEFTVSSQKRVCTTRIRKAYHQYFGCKVGDQEKPWAPYICCNSCVTALNEWLKKKRKAMPFAVPMIWREPTDHVNDYYFCHTPSMKKGFNRKKKSVIEYPNIPSAIRPVRHSDELPIPEPREIDLLSLDDAESLEECSVSEPCTSTNEEFGITTEPHLINKSELNDLVRDLDLPKVKAELLASRLKQWNLLQSGAKVCSFRTRQQSLAQFFSMKGGLVYCTDIGGIMQEFGYSHRPEQWRLFIDSSKLSLKAVLLHNKNMLPSIPVGYAAHMKETYENMKNLLQCINYEQYCWQLCGDFKVIAILLGLHPGYTKYCCFLCEWDSRARHEHYLKKEWPKRSTLKAGTKNVKYTPLVEASKILLPPLHINL